MPYPVLKINANDYPHLAENIWHAQMAGHPKVLTYVGPCLGRGNRREAMHFESDGVRQEILRILSRDEYPFACTLEGGKSSWAGHIPPEQNSAQGGLIAGFLRKHEIMPYERKLGADRSRFEVEVVNFKPGSLGKPSK
jgi:hypothetical protein